MFSGVNRLKLFAFVKIVSCIVMGILSWNLASQPQILRDLLVSGDSQILPLSMDVTDNDILNAYYERYRFATQLIGFAITSQSTSYGLVTLVIPEMGYSFSASFAVIMSALGAFMMFSVANYWAIIGGVIMSGLAEGFLLRSFMALTRLVPVVRYESSFAVIGLVSELGLIVPIIFRAVIDQMVTEESLTKDSRLSRLSAMWTVLTVVCGLITYFCIPKDMKAQYLTWKDIDQDRPVKEVTNEMKRQMIIYKEMQNRGASMSDFTYEYCEEDDQYGTSNLNNSKLISFTDPSSQAYRPPAGASMGAALFKTLFGFTMPEEATLNNPHLVNYRNFTLQTINWRIKIRNLFFYYSIWLNIINLAWRIYAWMYLEEALHEYCMWNRIQKNLGEEQSYFDFDGKPFTMESASYYLRLLTYLLPLSAVFSFFSTKIANLSIQFELWLCTLARAFTTISFCIPDPKWKIIGMMSWPITYTFAHSEIRVFVRELFGNHFVYFIEFVAGLLLAVCVCFMDKIEAFLEIPSKREVNGLVVGAFMDTVLEKIPFKDALAEKMPDMSGLFIRNRGFVYLGVGVVLSNIGIPMIRSYIDRYEYKRAVEAFYKKNRS